MAHDKQPDTTEQIDLFDLNMSDSELTSTLHSAIDRSKSYWDKEMNLTQIREKNMKLWKGEHWDDSQLYRHNVKYIDNRIFTSVETVISHATSKIAEAETFPAQNTTTSKQLAEDLGVALVVHSENNQLDVKAKLAARNILLKRIGFLKLRFDPHAGQFGDIVTESVDPDDVVVDKDAKLGENPRFIAHKLSATIEQLVMKFPEKQDDLYKLLGIKRGVASQLTQTVNYWEVWFTYYEDKQPKEGVCWLYEKLVLGKMRNPNWIYKKDKDVSANFLDYPLKPFIPGNYLNFGNHYIDDTTATEQAESLQHTLNKRGRQIVENADTANGVDIFSGMAMSDEAASELTGAPNEKIILDAEDVRSAYNRIQGQQLPGYVMDDKLDARNEMDNVFGTPNVFRGEQSGNNTLGQDVLVKDQAISRQDDFVRAIDDMMDRYYKYLTQMMKVYYTEDHWFKTTGENGQFDFVVMTSDKIEDGVDVRVRAGSSMPINKERMQAIALELAKANKISTIDLYEALDLPNANKMYERLIKEQMDASMLVDELQKEDIDREAFMDIQILNANKAADPRTEVTEGHLKYHREYMMSGEFRDAKPEVQQKHIDHVTLETENLRQRLLAEETQMPEQDDMKAANEQAVLEAQQTQQVAGADPQIQAMMQQMGGAPQPGGMPPEGGQAPQQMPPQGMQPPQAQPPMV